MTAKRYKIKLGRPFKFNNSKELEDLIEEYFKNVNMIELFQEN